MPLDPTPVVIEPPPDEVLADLARLRSTLDEDLPAKALAQPADSYLEHPRLR